MKMPEVECAFGSPERSEFRPDNTIKTTELVKVIPHCPLILMDDNKTISFPVNVNTNAIISFNLAYDTTETNYDLRYGAFSVDPGPPVPVAQFMWDQQIRDRRAYISETRPVNVSSHTKWQIGFKVSANVANRIRLTNILVAFEPWTSSSGNPA